MPWVRLEDTFASDPKRLAAGLLGMGLHVAGLCYSNRHLTDGFISEAALETLGPFLVDLPGGKRRRLEPGFVADRVVAAGLWCRVDGGYRILDSIELQPSRAEVESKRDAARSRMSALRNGSRPVRANTTGTGEEPAGNEPRSSRQVADPRTRSPFVTPIPPPDPNPRSPDVRANTNGSRASGGNPRARRTQAARRAGAVNLGEGRIVLCGSEAEMRREAEVHYPDDPELVDVCVDAWRRARADFEEGRSA